MMSELQQLSAGDYLSRRLNHPRGSNVSNDNQLSPVRSEKKVIAGNDQLTITASDTAYLVLKDTVDQYSHLTAVVQISKNSLSTIGDYLTEIKAKFEELNLLPENSDSRLTLNKDLKNLEDEMSKFISSVTINATRAKINISPMAQEEHQKYFDTVVNKGQFGPIEAKKLAEIEVNLAHTAIKQIGDHNELTCPICAMEAGDSLQNVNSSRANNSTQAINSNDLEWLAEAATNSTVVTSVTNLANSSNISTNIDALTQGRRWDLSASETLSWSYYVTSGVGYTYSVTDSSDGTAGNSLVNSAGDAAILQSMMDLWDKAGAFTYERVDETSANGTTTVGEIRMRGLNMGGTSAGYAAIAAFPTGSNWVRGADAWFTTGYMGPFVKGNSNWSTFLHEIGHAMGLSHPHSGSQSGATLGDFDDIRRRSIMSYVKNDRNYYFVNSGGSLSASQIHPGTPGIFDIQTIEYFYGTSTDTNLGDTTYSYVDKPIMLETIIDSGGSDTIDASNQTEEVRINLNGGTASSIGQWSRAEQISYYEALGLASSAAMQSTFNTYDSLAQSGYASPHNKGWYEGEDNLAIAFSSVIENAKGGTKADSIVGNSASNQITGNGGNDTLDGAGGTDYAIFSGALANYTITGNGTSAQITDNVGSNGSDVLKNFEYARFSNHDYDLSTGVASITSWKNTEPDYAKSYRPVVRGNGSINIGAFPVLAKLDFSQLQSVATGQFSGDPKALFTDGLKTDTEITDALDALDELLKQISEQQTIIASAQASINQNVVATVNSNTTEVTPGVISQALVAEVEEAGFVAELMVSIRAQIQGIINAQVNALAPNSEIEVVNLLI